MTDIPIDTASKGPACTTNESANVAAAKPATVNAADTIKTVFAKGIIAKTLPAKELGGPKGLEPTRYGDWEKNGRCSDF